MQDHSDLRKLFEACVESCSESMYRVAWRMTGDAGTAEELVQETFSQAWQKIDSLRDSAVESVVDHRLESGKNEQADIVQRAIEQLNDNQRLPILLVSMEGLSVDEASEILNIPRGTVLSRMHRGRQRLKEIIEKENAS